MWTRLQDFPLGNCFPMDVVSNWIYFTMMNLLCLGFLCIGTLPALYKRYEREVGYLAGTRTQDIRKLYKKLDSRVLNKIPRGPVKEKKFK
ncbi:hypothetical protein IFM89_035188 [Coptis chinensis]|uniref:Reticulon domain-containing protein n=1 Tax=Coptis chinensis TaxID=261450 RepID=A0A835M834_9MAGN|nr:hypothetical protein IFM89_035188 [Coptis chinensis]